MKEMDHTVYGPPCEELPTPDCIKASIEEFAAIYPAKISGGMPPSRPTDHRIDLVQDHKIPGQKLYSGGQGVVGAAKLVGEVRFYRAICFTVWFGSAYFSKAKCEVSTTC